MKDTTHRCPTCEWVVLKLLGNPGAKNAIEYERPYWQCLNCGTRYTPEVYERYIEKRVDYVPSR